MGWSGGSKLAAQVWAAVSPHLHLGEDGRVANEIIEAFENFEFGELGQESRYRLVKFHLALFHELQSGDSSDGFGHRRNLKDRIGGDRDA